MKTILIVGAGNAQVPLIKAAKNENYYTVVCDIDENAPGKVLADEFLKISTRDRQGLFETAKSRCVDGIVANSEYAMCDVAYIAGELGLVGNSEESISILSSKSKFRSLQHKTDLYAPKFVTVDHADTVIDTLTFPIIIKPDENSGTRGTTVVEDPIDIGTIKSSISVCANLSRNGNVIIEEYVSSETLATIEGEIFIHKGKVLWDGLFLTIRSKQATMIPMTYVFPLQETERRLEAVKSALSKAFRAADVSHGEYNVELFFADSGEPFIIEINPRQGGNDLPKYVQEYCGIDFYRLLVTTSMGDDRYWDSLHGQERTKHQITHHVLYPRKQGQLMGVDIAESIADHVYEKRLHELIGSDVCATTDGSSSIGYIDLEFSNSEEQLEASRNIEELIRIDVG